MIIILLKIWLLKAHLAQSYPHPSQLHQNRAKDERGQQSQRASKISFANESFKFQHYYRLISISRFSGSFISIDWRIADGHDHDSSNMQDKHMYTVISLSRRLFFPGLSVVRSPLDLFHWITFWLVPTASSRKIAIFDDVGAGHHSFQVSSCLSLQRCPKRLSFLSRQVSLEVQLWVTGHITLITLWFDGRLQGCKHFCCLVSTWSRIGCSQNYLAAHPAAPVIHCSRDARMWFLQHTGWPICGMPAHRHDILYHKWDNWNFLGRPTRNNRRSNHVLEFYFLILNRLHYRLGVQISRHI